MLIITIFLVVSVPVWAQNRPSKDSADRKEPVGNRFQNCPSNKKFVCDIENDTQAGLSKRKYRCVPNEVKNKANVKKSRK